MAHIPFHKTGSHEQRTTICGRRNVATYSLYKTFYISLDFGITRVWNRKKNNDRSVTENILGIRRPLTCSPCRESVNVEREREKERRNVIDRKRVKCWICGICIVHAFVYESYWWVQYLFRYVPVIKCSEMCQGEYRIALVFYGRRCCSRSRLERQCGDFSVSYCIANVTSSLATWSQRESSYESLTVSFCHCINWSNDTDTICVIGFWEEKKISCNFWRPKRFWHRYKTEILAADIHQQRGRTDFGIVAFYFFLACFHTKISWPD